MVRTLTFRVLYCFFVIEHQRRRILDFNAMEHPTGDWIVQQLREALPWPCPYRFDGDAKFVGEVRAFLKTSGIQAIRTGINAFAERWVRSVKSECLSHFILFGEGSLRRALKNFCEHYHEERNHQCKNNVLLFPAPARLEPGRRCGILCRECLGGLLRYYSRAA